MLQIHPPRRVLAAGQQLPAVGNCGGLRSIACPAELESPTAKLQREHPAPGSAELSHGRGEAGRIRVVLSQEAALPAPWQGGGCQDSDCSVGRAPYSFSADLPFRFLSRTGIAKCRERRLARRKGRAEVRPHRQRGAASEQLVSEGQKGEP